MWGRTNERQPLHKCTACRLVAATFCARGSLSFFRSTLTLLVTLFTVGDFGSRVRSSAGFVGDMILTVAD
jgi:hypothetical protein